VSKLAAAIRWQGPKAIEWIDARTARYEAERIWTRKQCRLAAGLDWELLRLRGTLDVDLRQPHRSIHSYFELHRTLDDDTAWFRARRRNLDAATGNREQGSDGKTTAERDPTDGSTHR
jgi:hypothetical protein